MGREQGGEGGGSSPVPFAFVAHRLLSVSFPRQTGGEPVSITGPHTGQRKYTLLSPRALRGRRPSPRSLCRAPRNQSPARKEARPREWAEDTGVGRDWERGRAPRLSQQGSSEGTLSSCCGSKCLPGGAALEGRRPPAASSTPPLWAAPHLSGEPRCCVWGSFALSYSRKHAHGRLRRTPGTQGRESWKRKQLRLAR